MTKQFLMINTIIFVTFSSIYSSCVYSYIYIIYPRYGFCSMGAPSYFQNGKVLESKFIIILFDQAHNQDNNLFVMAVICCCKLMMSYKFIIFFDVFRK